MATRAQPVQIGPWVGGMNTQSDPTAVADEEAVDITNFDIDIDGSLKSRPAIIPAASTGTRFGNRVLGIYSTLAGVHYLIFSSTDAAGLNPSTNFYNINTGAYGTIVSTFGAMAMVQLQNKAWLVSSPTASVTGGSFDGTTYTNSPTMAKGATACVYKNRIFIGTGELDTVNPGVLYWSSISDPNIWNAFNDSGNTNVNSGDGQSIRKIYSYQGSIIIFKARSTYIFAYESDPFKGQQQPISLSIGIDGLDCLAEHQSILYVLSSGDAYAISNWNWEQVNVRVPFVLSDAYLTANWTRHCCVSSVGNRIIFRYYDSHYVFNTTTRTWTLWRSSLTPDQFFKSPIVDTTTGIDQYVAGNYLKWTQAGSSSRLFLMKDAITTSEVESYTSSLRTKVYSYIPFSFKRLMWWGIDLLSKSKVDVTVIPVTYGLPVRWNQLPPRTWAQMSPGTWGAPLSISISVNDSVTLNNPTGVRMFVKYLKSLRFRQIQFVVTSTLDGTTLTGPLQIYSITGFIVNKQLVPAKIN
jgi:hypothetical protein